MSLENETKKITEEGRKKLLADLENLKEELTELKDFPGSLPIYGYLEIGDEKIWSRITNLENTFSKFEQKNDLKKLSKDENEKLSDELSALKADLTAFKKNFIEKCFQKLLNDFAALKADLTALENEYESKPLSEEKILSRLTNLENTFGKLEQKNDSKKFAKDDHKKLADELSALKADLNKFKKKILSKKITAEGRKKLLDDLEILKKNLKDLRDNKASAYTSTGDTWHDNPYFNELERDEGRLLIQIANVEQILKSAEIISNSNRNTDKIEIGSIFKCTCAYDEDDIEENIFEIVGHGETDIDNGKIHYESPVAKNLLGHKLNDAVDFKTPAGDKVTYKILAFYKNWDEAKRDA